MATGLRDELPEVPGVRERWGRDLLHCPYCHGYEVRDQPLGVLGGAPEAVHHALLVRQWSPDVTLFPHTDAVGPEQRDQLAARGIRIVDVTGAGTDAQTLIAIGAVLELLLIIANVGTAVVPYSIHKRVHEAGAVAYVTARLVECTFIAIAIGIVCMLAISSLRQDAPSGTDAAVGQGIFAVYEWTFRIGPGVFAGIGNGLILGWLMYRSGLLPPRLALFGLVGGPLVSIVGALVILDVLPADGPVQVLVAPEFIWELGIGIYLIVKGYRTSSPALAGTQDAAAV